MSLALALGSGRDRTCRQKEKKKVRNIATKLSISEMWFKEVNFIFRLNSFHFVSPKALDSAHELTGFHLTFDVILHATDIIV